MLTGADLARTLGVSAARVSQYVSEGRLDGCFSGEGRLRRFDLDKVCERLNRKLDKGQMLGNGSATRRRLEQLSQSGAAEVSAFDSLRQAPEPRRGKQLDGGALSPNDPDGYELARTQLAIENARAARRKNDMEAGTLVLATEVERQVARAIAQEIAEFEGVLKTGARAIADRLGVDFKTARSILVDCWRSHRGTRSDALADQASAAQMTDEERDADF